MSVFSRVSFLLTGLEDQEDGTTVQYDFADRLALGGFHADRWHWLRGLGRTSYCPRRVNRGSYPGHHCRCESCVTRDSQGE